MEESRAVDEECGRAVEGEAWRGSPGGGHMII